MSVAKAMVLMSSVMVIYGKICHRGCAGGIMSSSGLHSFVAPVELQPARMVVELRKLVEVLETVTPKADSLNWFYESLTFPKS